MSDAYMKYKIHTEPSIFTILNKVEADCTMFGINPEDYLRAVWVWASDRIAEKDTPPDWLWVELARQEQLAEADNTIEGEVGS